MITLDTSGLVAAIDRRDPDHLAVMEVLDRDPGPYVIPAMILAEIAWLVETRFGTQVLVELLLDLIDGRYVLDVGAADVSRIRDLVLRYADLPLGFSDAAVVACAERLGGRVLTLDRRHFGVVARERAISVWPLETG